MEAAGVHWRWPETPVDHWVPKDEARPQRTWREHHVLLEEDGTVRGACAIKPHDWWIDGETIQVTDWHGPITEGVIDRKFMAVGLRMIREMQKRAPLLYSWGHGGLETPMLKMLESMGFLMYGTPFCLRVLRPARFLRHNAYLRTSPLRRLAQDGLAFSGLGWIGVKSMDLWKRARRSVPRGLRVEEFARFDAWADELWERVRSRYSAIAYRDAATMNDLVPKGGWPKGIRLRVLDGDRLLGWAVVLDTQMKNDVRFGDLRVGSIIDCLAAPEDAEAVVAGADAYLAGRGVDCIMSNQAHPRWREAFSRNGYLLLEERRFLAASPALEKTLSPFEEKRMGLHMTNMDGHGPMRM
ncbi:MAG: hypothetical protein ACX98W_01875 [bacterium]